MHYVAGLPVELRNKTYPLRIVLDAITQYDLGYSLDETAEKVRTRNGHRVARSTIAGWLAEHRSLTTYTRLRADGRRLYPPRQTIRAIKLYHRQVYQYAYHRPKIALLGRGGNTPGSPVSPISSSAFPPSVPTSCS
jgi:hypothetical protein